MIKKGVVFLVLLIIPINVYAGRGCCSWHGGQDYCGDEGYWICKDGTRSPTCTCSSQKITEYPNENDNTKTNNNININQDKKQDDKNDDNIILNEILLCLFLFLIYLIIYLIKYNKKEKSNVTLLKDAIIHIFVCLYIAIPVSFFLAAFFGGNNNPIACYIISFVLTIVFSLISDN